MSGYGEPRGSSLGAGLGANIERGERQLHLMWNESMRKALLGIPEVGNSAIQKYAAVSTRQKKNGWDRSFFEL